MESVKEAIDRFPKIWLKSTTSDPKSPKLVGDLGAERLQTRARKTCVYTVRTGSYRRIVVR
jgi:predicted restriction endonuclease